ncbi:MAG: alpha/beta hydrolase, partial [Burkholderiales bacterium]|nr:alpha/beta hydrolase [Burkholderiales bacterium]
MAKIFYSICSILVVLLYIDNANAQTWQPSPGHTQIPIWPPGKMPDPLPDTKMESMEIVTQSLVAGKPRINLSDVSKPTITIYSPKSKNTGAAVVVFPGGGFNGLAIDLEGTEICDWLTGSGITCVLLKYRVPDSGPAWHNDCNCNIEPRAPTALEDAQRTLGLVRLNAKKWHINP